MAQPLSPPLAKQVPHSFQIHGQTRVDPFHWMRQRENSEVIAYLEAENAYLESVLAPEKVLRVQLYEEMKARIKPDDMSLPYCLGGNYYYRRYEAGNEYPIHCRRIGSMETEETILLDVNQLAEGHSYCQVSGPVISPDQRWLACGVDTIGRRFYTLRFLNLDTNIWEQAEIPDVTGNLVWASDSQTVYYRQQHPETLRAYRIYRYQVGNPVSEAELLYEESDEAFNCYLYKSKSKAYIFLHLHSTITHEVRYLAADDVQADFEVFHPRSEGHEYSIDHLGDWFFIHSNEQARNFCLFRCPVSRPEKAHWKLYVAHREEILLEDIELFDTHLVLEERRDGLAQIRVKDWAGTEDYYLPFHDPTYLAYVAYHPESETRELRFGYQSLTTPNSVFGWDLQTQKQTLLKQQAILGGFEVNDYQSERLFAPASDGTLIPMSVVYRKDQRKAGPQPLLLYGYGAYGHSMDPYFSLARISLLDRGFVFVIAHVRGGSEMGRKWYESGRLLQKKNSFTDFIACAEYLIRARFTQPEQLACMGGSAGGLLIGAVINLRPDLFQAAVADVPFVDVINTMLDDSIPLTTEEYHEWGNPNDKEYYDYILSYSPYDNVGEKPYPHILVASGLHDSQVQYWEPTKWVAKLRSHMPSDRLLLLNTNMEAGHSGASGRYGRLEEVALEYAFLLKVIKQ